ncbi:class I SAM-dependent methyltransferase [Trujillonella endophytica]|uniref:Methyltransferase domain-containing protein n=1 Tax=Trujillonella endophytica TaxID=673521 RepID=A0A1H8VBJ3_9ACTN|nr:class I SAM-dependent methyltransferase [Trujillella endophytica]SEP12701.1 Methyltransferase domain-containing protein [Trujillella endophytica]
MSATSASTPDLVGQVASQPAASEVGPTESFAGDVLGVLNSSMLALMISIGHRTRLFDTMSGLEPADSATIAAAAGLHERYVREWLGAMATGRIVDHDRESGTFHLPPERAAVLTRAAGPDNLASFAQFVSLLGKVEDDVVHSFESGGGVPYSAYPEFQRLMAEESAAVFDATLLDVTVRLVEGLPERLTAGIDVADVGCGSGHALNLLAEAYPRSRCVGFDFSAEGVAVGTAEAASKGLSNVRFEVRDAATLTGPSAFDLVTAFDAVHDQAHPARVLRGIHDLLRPGGTFLCVDIQAASHVADNLDHPLGPFLYTVSCMHCMTVSLALDGDGLGAAWGEELALTMLREAGFTDIEVRHVEGDILNNYYVAKRP